MQLLKRSRARYLRDGHDLVLRDKKLSVKIYGINPFYKNGNVASYLSIILVY